MLTASVLFSYKPSFALHFLSHAVARERTSSCKVGTRCLQVWHFLQVWLQRDGNGQRGLEPKAPVDEANRPLCFILAKAVVSICRVNNDWKAISSLGLSAVDAQDIIFPIF